MAPDGRHPPRLEQLQREALSRIFGQFVAVRAFVAVLAFGFMLSVCVADGARWRIASVSVLTVSVWCWTWVELLAFRRSGLRPGTVPRNLAVLIAVQLVVMFVMGGIECPLLPTVFPLVLLTALFTPPRTSLLLGAAQIVAIWCFAIVRVRGLAPGLVPSLFGGEIHGSSDPTRFWTIAALLSAFQPFGWAMGTRLQTWFTASLERTIATRDASLAVYGEQMRALTALSGEIAHELKNPLASVKGLSALISRDLEGKTAERMAVLRREVDRMQGILEEFLNYSRPLVPLSLERVDLGALCEDTAQLHEGMARERHVTIAVRAHALTPSRCDPRKVKQILVNLIQNALDASSPGGEVTLVVTPADDGAEITVSDRGPGLSPGVADSIFEPGVTTKEGGSGLGLTVARALARQHGGDLALRAREGGGCQAILTLPGPDPDPAPERALTPEGASA